MSKIHSGFRKIKPSSKLPSINILYQSLNNLKREIKDFDRILKQIQNLDLPHLPSDAQTKLKYRKHRQSWNRFMMSTINHLKKLNKTSTAKNYETAHKKFMDFLNKPDIPIESINTTLIDAYQYHLIDQGLSLNSISFYTRILRAAYNKAVRQLSVADRKPFINSFTGMEKTRKRAISKNTIKRLRNLDLSAQPQLEFSRDIFLFLFLCRGMSFIDAAFLKKSNVKEDIITYRRHKTGQVINIKIVSQISALINKYSDYFSPYLLPIIKHPGKNERRQYESALRNINRNLKLIGEKAELDIVLTTYVSRHSWATIAKEINIPLNVISDALGHESARTTQIYLDSIGSLIIDKANDKVISGI